MKRFSSDKARPRSKQMPTPPPHSPIHQDNSLASPRRRQCQYHICTCTQLRSPLRDPTSPNNRLLLSSSFRPWWSSPGKEVGPAVGCQGHLLGNVVSWCAGIRCLENNEYSEELVEPRPPGNGSAHLPTDR